jgi:hypothetical protein
MFLVIKKSLCVVFLLVSCGALAPASTEPQVIVHISADASSCAVVENSLCGPSLLCVYKNADDLYFYTVSDFQKLLLLVEQNTDDVIRVSQLKIINDFVENFQNDLVLQSAITDLECVFATHSISAKKISSFEPRWGIARASLNTNKPLLGLDLIRLHEDVSLIDDHSGDIFADNGERSRKIFDERAMKIHPFAFLYLTSARDFLFKKEPKKEIVPVDVIIPETKAIIIPPAAALTMGNGLLWGFGGFVAAGLAAVGLLNIDVIGNIDGIGFANDIPPQGAPLAVQQALPPVFFGPRLPPLGVAEPAVPVEQGVIDLSLVPPCFASPDSAGQMVGGNLASTASLQPRSRATHGSISQLFIDPQFLCGVVAKLIQVGQLPQNFLTSSVLNLQVDNGEKLTLNGTQVINFLSQVDFSQLLEQSTVLEDASGGNILSVGCSFKSDFLEKLIRFLMSRFRSSEHTDEELLLCASGSSFDNGMISRIALAPSTDAEATRLSLLQTVSTSEQSVIVSIPDIGKIELNHNVLQLLRSLTFAMQQHQRFDLAPQKRRLPVWKTGASHDFDYTSFLEKWTDLSLASNADNRDRSYSFDEIPDDESDRINDPLNTARIEGVDSPLTPPRAGAGDRRPAPHSAPRLSRRSNLNNATISAEDTRFHHIFGNDFLSLPRNIFRPDLSMFYSSPSAGDSFVGPAIFYWFEYKRADQPKGIYYVTWSQVLTLLKNPSLTADELAFLKLYQEQSFLNVRNPLERELLNFRQITNFRICLSKLFEKYGINPKKLEDGFCIHDGLVDMFRTSQFGIRRSFFRFFLSKAATLDENLLLVPTLDSSTLNQKILEMQRNLGAYPFMYLKRKAYSILRVEENFFGSRSVFDD